MATPLGTTFVTDEQVVAQGDVLYKGKTVESLVVEFDQAKYEEFLSSGSKSPKARAYRRVSTGICPEIRSEIPSDAAAVRMSWLIAPRVTTAPTSLRRPAWSTSLVSSQSALFFSTRSSGVPLNLHDATGTLNGGRGGVRVNYKLERPIVQQR